MSQEEKKAAPSVRNLMQPGQTTDRKYLAVERLITSDKDNATKTRIQNVLTMTYLDILPTWNTAKSMEELWSPTKEGQTLSFGDRYRINAIAMDGESRKEYVDALKNYLPEVPGLYNRDDKQLKEGNKK